MDSFRQGIVIGLAVAAPRRPHRRPRNGRHVAPPRAHSAKPSSSPPRTPRPSFHSLPSPRARASQERTAPPSSPPASSLAPRRGGSSYPAESASAHEDSPCEPCASSTSHPPSSSVHSPRSHWAKPSPSLADLGWRPKRRCRRAAWRCGERRNSTLQGAGVVTHGAVANEHRHSPLQTADKRLASLLRSTTEARERDAVIDVVPSPGDLIRSPGPEGFVTVAEPA